MSQGYCSQLLLAHVPLYNSISILMTVNSFLIETKCLVEEGCNPEARAKPSLSMHRACLEFPDQSHESVAINTARPPVRHAYMHASMQICAFTSYNYVRSYETVILMGTDG